MKNKFNKSVFIFVSIFLCLSFIFSITAFAIESPYITATINLTDIGYVNSTTLGGTYKMFALRVGSHSERPVCIKAEYSYGYAWSTDKSIYVDPGHSIDNQATSVMHGSCLWRMKLHTSGYLPGGSATGYMWYKI